MARGVGWANGERQMPAYGFMLDNTCVFHGEEVSAPWCRSGSEESDPKSTLAATVDWVYDPAPYMLGESTPNCASFAPIWLRRVLRGRDGGDTRRYPCT
ncbi:hypothetical protein SCP_0600660 [Sparassis crispa]|uniref:Uncharacterized protein n=1 Tax=Sparassis crispa TaxID=139825 RepID=A0A401GPE6_9APHY|nr:hypothetical protein SCP_0600660 [Sparassis crispa]GBE84088.1 hypothetical protein SCP_0600660 [Sparassis crispa]